MQSPLSDDMHGIDASPIEFSLSTVFGEILH